jgi:hypothetical protein
MYFVVSSIKDDEQEVNNRVKVQREENDELRKKRIRKGDTLKTNEESSRYWEECLGCWTLSSRWRASQTAANIQPCVFSLLF